ncbi:MAG: tripartite tricarboxylate transporter substrate binding protein, partial [Thermodesulfobacteriota bacterium]
MKKGKLAKINLWLTAFFLLFAGGVYAQSYPDKAITIYCGYAAGATTDLTARALASGAEKLLGVPVVVENKPGGGATVAAALVASKKPDGYTLGVVSTGVISVRPHLLKVGYDPLKDFTLINQYARYIGGLCVLSESPIKTIEEFIAYAKAHPGLSYASPGMYTQQHLAVELFRQCQGLEFKHVPTKGGAEANTQLLGKHVNFVAGAGQHIQYLKQGVFRMLLVFNTDKRDPNYPNAPTLKELGCQDAPALGYIVVAPKGLPEAIAQKLEKTFHRVAESGEFQKVLANLEIPYDYKGRAQLEREAKLQYDFYKTFL